MKQLIILVSILALVPSLAFAQTTIPNPDMPINFSAAHGVIIVIGSLGGLTSAYLGFRKNKRADQKITFDITKFFDRVILAVITSVGLAITAAAGFMELNAITMFLIYVASLGTSELVIEARKAG